MIETTFIDELASASPTPGGGGASAYCGALASSLASMVCNLTVGKKTYAAVEADVIVSAERLSDLRDDLVRLIDEDARAFEPLAACYRMPTETPEQRDEKCDAMERALVSACDVPLEIMRRCEAIIAECDFLAEHASKLAASDTGAAVLLAFAALKAASLNITINTKSMLDRDRAEGYDAEVRQLIEGNERRSTLIYEAVVNRIRS